jgi:hypothetical protein
MHYFPVPTPPTLERIHSFINRQLAHWEKYGYGHWGVVLRGQTEIAGWAGLQYLSELDET